ncbi:MAG: zinc ABC transporter substrate-binding protein, partial [Acidiferrobacterales bacterium]|nr:zinc ABC transporter substrate-binding protein [Acidiferrobacterales bacterium]
MLLSTCASLAPQSDADRLSVITATQATYSLSSAMLEGTAIEVINIPADGRRFDSLKDYIQRRKEQFKSAFQNASAVVSFTNALPIDPLYRFARQANINLVNIDAAQPWSYDESGVSLVTSPLTSVAWNENKSNSAAATQSNTQSKYFWLSLSNAIRMTDIVGTDLARVFPQRALLITANRDRLKQQLLDLSWRYQRQFLEVENPSIFALANEFVYLTNDLGLYVDGYFLKQDIDWTEQDFQSLTDHLRSNDIQVVLHKWQPKQEIVEAIERAGARLVILDTADPGLPVDRNLVVDGYQQILESNLQALISAMKAE